MSIRSGSAFGLRAGWCFMPGNYWVGAGRVVVGVRDHARIPPLLSEREGLRLSEHHRHVGSWCLSIDTNWRGKRRMRKGKS